MRRHKIHALHGFLGSPEDWYSLGFEEVEDFFTVHLFKDLPIISFDEWARQFNQCVAEGEDCREKPLLMGYSLGGRLGLHALLQQPNNWKAAIFMSTHPGLKSTQERDLRIAADEKWAKRFEDEPWDSLMQDWNAQNIFKNVAPHRSEGENSRLVFSSALKIWSLGNQQDLSQELAVLNMPILWIVGAEDEKFYKIAQQLEFKHPQSTVYAIPEAGHRVLWEQSEKCKLKISEFIRNLKE